MAGAASKAAVALKDTGMDQGLALIVVGAMTITGPLLLAGMTAVIRRGERHEDRLDRLAVAEAVAEVAKEAKTTSVRTESQLKEIHTLVNSGMTASIQGELDRTKIALVLHRRIRDMSAIAGIPDTEDDMAAVVEAQKHIKQLESVLADRQVKLAEADAARLKGTP